MSKYILKLLLPIICFGFTDFALANFTDANAKKAIYEAALANRTDLLQNYVLQNINIDATDENGMTALCSALQNKEQKAYDLLLYYRANPNHPCMQKIQSSNKKLYWTAGILGAGAAIAAIAAGGGGGGGGGGSDSSSSSETMPQNNDTLPSTFYSEADFNKDAEYLGTNFGSAAVNYMSAINAAKAFANTYKQDENKNFTADLADVHLGMIDTGVWGNHQEFLSGERSKISGYNFDYGPCLNGNTENCWQKYGEQKCQGNVCKQKIKLLGTNQTDTLECQGKNCNAYDEWKSKYPQDYDWEKMQDYFYPNENEDDLHGTTIAGLILANHDGKGNMGIMPTNATLSAVRWDLMSDMGYPLAKLREEGNVLAINISIGIPADEAVNAALARTDLSYFADETLKQYSQFIQDYADESKTHTIFVKSAGNENFSDADVWSGLKLNPNYENLLMLVVTSVDVTLNNDLSVKSYTKSSFANACGSTAQYCLAAPGGNKTSSKNTLLYSVGFPDDSYEAMAGTSQATPLVTAAVAFLKAKYNYLSSEEIVDLLLDSANKEAADEYSEQIYGAGLLDLYAATQYVPAQKDAKVTTFATDRVSGPVVDLNAANLHVSSALKATLLKALPQSIAVFDKYKRPFAVALDNYIVATDDGFKKFENDVVNIAAKPMQIVKNGGTTFKFSQSTSSAKNAVSDFIGAEYTQDFQTKGFYFAADTVYNSADGHSKELHNPFASLKNAYGFYNINKISDNFSFKTEAIVGKNGLSEKTRRSLSNKNLNSASWLNFALNFYKQKRLSFGLNAGVLYEKSALFGATGQGAFGLPNSQTYGVGVVSSYKLTEKFSLNTAYYRGFTGKSKISSNMLQLSDLQSESFALDLNYKNNSESDWGLRFSSPLKIVKGKVAVDIAQGRDNFSDTVYRTQYTTTLKSAKREYKVSAYLNKALSKKVSIASEIGIRFNPEHQNASNDYQALCGINWYFN